MAGIYKCILVRRAAAYSIFMIGQVNVFYCETAHGAYVTQRETPTVTTAHSRAAAAAAAALCMHIKLTSRLLRGHLNQHLTYFYTAKQNKGNATRTKKHHPGFEPRTSRSERQQPTCYPTLSLVRIDRDWYVSICTNRRLGKFDLETKTAPAAGRRREHGRGRPRQSRERRAR